MSFIYIKQLTKRFKGANVLNEVSLEIEKGELVTLLGPSGCGKSTLLRCIAGLTDTEKDSGILIGGIDISQFPPKDRGVGMVFQSYALFPNMTVFDNIGFGLKMKGISKEDYVAKIKRMIDLVDLADRENSYPHQLSGGQQQRVALARSLVIEPKVLLLDEPLSALDAKIRKNLQTEIRRIQQELSITTIFVTHDQEEALTVSDRIFIMDQGKVVQGGRPHEVYNRPSNEFVARFIGNYNVLCQRQFQQLIGVHSMKGAAVAIRPEVIQLCDPQVDISSRPENGWTVNGVISTVSLKGNIVRLEVQLNSQFLMVDILNTPCHNWVQPGTQVKLWIPTDQCIPLQSA